MKDAPATKTDIQRLESKIESLDSKSTRMLALEIGKTHYRMDQLETGLRQEMRQLNSTVLERMDTWAGRFETIWRESALFPRVMDEHGETLRDHESRLRRLES